MPHPKRRTSKHCKRKRRSHLALEAQVPNNCPRCGSPSRPHRVCDNCGFYGFDKGGSKGSAVLIKEEEF